MSEYKSSIPIAYIGKIENWNLIEWEGNKMGKREMFAIFMFIENINILYYL